jgi:hypothetical protein
LSTTGVSRSDGKCASSSITPVTHHHAPLPTLGATGCSWSHYSFQRTHARQLASTHGHVLGAFGCFFFCFSFLFFFFFYLLDALLISFSALIYFFI